MYETSRQSRFDARYWMLGAGALGRPRRMVRGGRREEGSGWETRVYLWRIHVDIWQKQYNIVKLKNKIKFKKIKKKRKKKEKTNKKTNSQSIPPHPASPGFRFHLASPLLTSHHLALIEVSCHVVRSPFDKKLRESSGPQRTQSYQ